VGEVRAELDVLESCALELSNEGTSAGTAADALGDGAPDATSAGTTPASAELIAAVTRAAAHWSSDTQNADQFRSSSNAAV